MKTNMKIRRQDVEKLDEEQGVDSCRLERLKMTGAYAPAGQAEAWAEGIAMQQREIGCDVVRKPKLRARVRRPRLPARRP
jgi:hypothetical protein